MPELVKIAGVQMDVDFANCDANLARMEAHLRRTAAEGALLTVFPECALTGYCFESLEEARPHAQSVPGAATEALARLCRELGVYTIFGMLELATDQIFNAAVLVGPEGLIGNYRKIHLPYLGVDRFTTPGDRQPAVWQCGPLRVGINICYDGSFPEPSRCMALGGADLLVLPTNWPPGAESTANHIINARAVENQVFYLAVNRAGEERGFRFIGGSRLAHPRGDNVCLVEQADEQVFFGEIDLEIARNKHLVRVPGLHEIDRFKDRRPEMYGRIVAEDENGASSSSGRAAPPWLPETNESPLRQRLWAPWRLAYIKGAEEQQRASAEQAKQDADPDFIARAVAEDRDRENLVVYRGRHTVVILNRYPYNNGHLLVAPMARKARLDELSPEEHLECMQVLSHLVALLEQLVNANGFNVGLNLGSAAGAGLPGHLHWHIVPRWFGDTNFMTVLDDIRVIPQSLDAMWELLTAGLAEHPVPG